MNTLNKKLLLVSAITAASSFIAISVQASVVVLDDGFTGSVLGEALQFGDLGSSDWRATAGSNWTISSGALSNGGGGTAAQNAGGVGKLIDLTGISDASLNQLDVNVGFNLSSTTEQLYLHVPGYVGSAPASTLSFFNQNATNGNAWDTAAGSFDSAFTLNDGTIVDGSSSGTVAANAIRLDNGTTGLQMFSTTLDLSSHAVNNIAGYDYLVVAFTRNAFGGSPNASIESINLTAIPESSTYVLFVGLAGLSFVLTRRRR